MARIESVLKEDIQNHLCHTIVYNGKN